MSFQECVVMVCLTAAGVIAIFGPAPGRVVFTVALTVSAVVGVADGSRWRRRYEAERRMSISNPGTGSQPSPGATTTAGKG